MYSDIILKKQGGMITISQTTKMITVSKWSTYGLKDSAYIKTKTENTSNIIRKEAGMVIVYG